MVAIVVRSVVKHKSFVISSNVKQPPTDTYVSSNDAHFMQSITHDFNSGSDFPTLICNSGSDFPTLITNLLWVVSQFTELHPIYSDATHFNATIISQPSQWHQRLAMVRQSKPDLFVHENVLGFPTGLLTEVLGVFLSTCQSCWC